jgi:hypothetical protein
MAQNHAGGTNSCLWGDTGHPLGLCRDGPSRTRRHGTLSARARTFAASSVLARGEQLADTAVVARLAASALGRGRSRRARRLKGRSCRDIVVDVGGAWPVVVSCSEVSWLSS